MSGPLTGFTVLELAGIGPGPYAGQLLADMGARVIVVERPSKGMLSSGMPSIDKRGKESIVIDLRQKGASDLILKTSSCRFWLSFRLLRSPGIINSDILF